jgi:hypothetical protein
MRLTIEYPVTAAATLQGSGTSLNSLARRAFIVASAAFPPAIASKVVFAPWQRSNRLLLVLVPRKK